MIGLLGSSTDKRTIYKQLCFGKTCSDTAAVHAEESFGPAEVRDGREVLACAGRASGSGGGKQDPSRERAGARPRAVLITGGWAGEVPYSIGR